MDTLSERFIAWFLRSIAGALLFAGISMLLPGVPLFAVLPTDDLPELRLIGSRLLQLGGILLVTGLAAKYLLRSRKLPLPNEQVTIADDRRPAVEGWLLVLAFTVAVVPLLLVARLQPFFAEARPVAEFLESTSFWNDRSGLVLLPLAGALTPPFLQLATTAAFIGTSVIALVLLLARSHRFPRTFIVCLVLATGLLVASHHSASSAKTIADILQQQIARARMNAEELATINEGIERYTGMLDLAGSTLMWTWTTYVIWLPAMFSSTRVRETFARPLRRPIEALERPRDVVAVTAPPKFPGFF
jgi:hypothetical protein